MQPIQHTGVVVKIGSDRVCVGRDTLVIEAMEVMDWPVREFYRLPIYFEGRKYVVRQTGPAAAPYAKCYELVPWPVDQPEQSTRMVIYDEAYVLDRDATARARRGGDTWHFILLPFFPFLGLFWSGFKNRVLVKVGFAPREITSASIALVFFVMFVETIFVGWLGLGLLTWFLHSTAWRAADYLFLLLLIADVVMRYSQHLEADGERPWGFGEWAWRKKKK